MDGFGAAAREWFKREVGEPTAVQREGWPMIRRALDEKSSVLISAPTGTGKTLTAFLHFIDELTTRSQHGKLANELYVLYISPLKALGNDIRVNLIRPIDGISRLQRESNSTAEPAQATAPGNAIRIAVRNGDTTPSERHKMLNQRPHILITTPESLYLLLLSEGGRRLLASTRAVILDEIHAIMESKRGAHLMVSLERLNELCGGVLPRIGLSATVRPLEMAATFLAGYGDDGLPRPVGIVAPQVHKRVELTTALAVSDLRALPEGSIWPFVHQRVYAEARHVRTTLAFCESRAVSEKLAYGVNALAENDVPPHVEFARTHHGCVSREQRLEAETQLKSGQLKLMCATSSMELGIDVGEIDLVVQIGAPASISRATQRLGRAGHSPGEVSRMLMLPLYEPDILRDAFICWGVEHGELETTHPPRMCLDVLAQQLVAMSAVGDYSVEQGLALMRRTYCLHSLERAQLESVLRMLAGDFEHMDDKPVRPRILYDRVNGVVAGDNWSRMLALRSGGTIPDMGWYKVVTADGIALGELDEEFVFEARRGDRFLLGAFSWQITNITRDKVIVAPSERGGAQSPFWKGASIGRPYDVGCMFGRHMAGLESAANAGRLESELGKYPLDENARLNAARYLSRQLDQLGALPTDHALVIEHFHDQAGEAQLAVHSVFGARVNLPLGLLLQRTAQRLTGHDIRMHYDDDGVLLHMQHKSPLPMRLLSELNPDTVRADLMKLLPGAPLFTISFRCNAMRALMMGARAQGRVPLWVQRLRGAEAFDRALEYADHPLLWETMRECMEDYTDIAALEQVLSRVRDGSIRVMEKRVDVPSPMARSLRGLLKGEEMYDYSPTPSAALRLTLTGTLSSRTAADDDELVRLAPAPQAAQLLATQTGERAPESPDQLHARLMQRGDALPGEMDAPGDWLEQLAAHGRVAYIEPGLWIAAEQRELYDSALNGDMDSLERVIRRCVRYYGPVTDSALVQRYSIDSATIHEATAALAETGILRAHALGWVHRDVYERAQRIEARARREEITTAPPEAYAALLTSNTYAGTPLERLRAAMPALVALLLPVEHWENVVLPARAGGYRPGMIDALLAAGEYTWRLTPSEGQPLLAFYNSADVDWQCSIDSLSMPADLQPDEIAVLNALMRRGASFAAVLNAVLGGRDALPTLGALCERGLVTCDSLAPLRRKPTARSVRARVSGRVQLQSSGRWELARPILVPDMDARIARALDRWHILSKETARREGIPWPDALARLRTMEYAQLVRRGYFVRGMSGAQFVRESALASVVNRLVTPSDDYVAINAVDPLQPYGAILPHSEGRAFTCVPGTVLIMRAGQVQAICERQCASIRLPEHKDSGKNSAPQHIDPAQILQALVGAYRRGEVFTNARKLCVRSYPAGWEPGFASAGFVPEALDRVIYK